MKSEKIIEFIRHPEKINNDDLRELHTLVERYPYFQTARILYLKALYLLGGVRFRSELKASTVHLTDHKQFFRYLNNQIGFEPLGSGTANVSAKSMVIPSFTARVFRSVRLPKRQLPDAKKTSYNSISGKREENGRKTMRKKSFPTLSDWTMYRE